MSYFANHYKDVSFPDSEDGLRNAQLGAIHSICAHFSIHSKEPAIVTLPTGTGKTAVLIMSAFLLKAKKVLVLSSTILVRGQIVNEFQKLVTLKRQKVLPSDLEEPKVIEISSPLLTTADWQRLDDFDVVVGFPANMYPGIENGLTPQLDLFDLILVDEAHHSPAKTWQGLLDYFSKAKKILFTATPFRRDRREVPGKLIYNYPLSRAKEDRVFGQVGYIAVNPATGESQDLAIARATEKVFNEDRAAGLDHYVLIRTEKLEHAKQLLKVYQENTKLNIRKIDSSQTYSYILKTIKALKDKKLDGIICVNMLGEGFDFPNLKIAAIHAHHKSLAVTLQFIGRFTRTNAPNIGTAKFLSTQADITLGKQQLYFEGAIWDELIVSLSEDRVEIEDEAKSVVESFVLNENQEVESEEFNLYNINPFFHVKVYRVNDFKIDNVLNVRGQEIIYHFKSEENSMVVFITKEVKKPKWLNSDDLINTKHFIFMLYYFEEEGLLFLHSSIRTVQFYDALIDQFTTSYERIPKEDINKVLSNLRDIDFFNIGMQNRAADSGESYKTITGSSAQNAIKKSDGRMYSNGHIYAKAKTEDDSSLTIGYSSGAKLWSNAYLKVNEFINFCQVFGKKINSNAVVKTNTGFDMLPIGKPVQEFPSDVYSITWDYSTFQDAPILYKCKDDEIISEHQLLDFELVLDKSKSTSKIAFIKLESDKLSLDVSFSFTDHFKLDEGSEFEYRIHDLSLTEYLNEYSLKFFLTDFSIVHHHEWLPTPAEGELHYDGNLITIFDWAGYNIDITREFYDTPAEKLANGSRESIHEGLLAYLKKTDASIIIYDHGTGEMADYVTLKEVDTAIEIELYHAKKSGGTDEGDRVTDVYDVCGQANKSLIWTTNRQTFLKKLQLRVEGKETSKFIKGNLSECESMLAKGKILKFTIHVVQPGITKAGLSEKVSTVLASSHGYIQSNGNNERLSILASA
ncbi:MAG: DEAD/DEAH box helicase family protein [Cytophagales bacterium]|nr:DEAD/DEAH box helicase family protein [Cytophagales bacterium]